MANYATLIAAIQNVVKTNGNNEITGALLQQSLLAMITSLGAGYQFMDVATPQTTPGTPDQNVFYIGGPGTYSNMGGTVVNDGEIGIFRYNGSWSNKKLTVGKDYSNEIDELDRVKLDKIVGTNLFNVAAAEQYKYIGSSGGIVSTSSEYYYVSDYIPVKGQNIIGYGVPSTSAIGSYNVYDINKNLLRTVTQNSQYTYQSGDYYVRFTFNNANGDARCNYGTTILPFEPYTDFKPLTDLEKEVGNISALTADIPNKLAKQESTNLVNPDEILVGATLPYGSTTGEPSTGKPSSFKVSGYIYVDGKNIISNAYGSGTTWASMFIYDSRKRFLRSNGTNQQYTYQAGDAYVRISFHKVDIRECLANYGSSLLPYTEYYEYKPLIDLRDSLVGMLDGKLDKQPSANLIDPSKVQGGKYISSSGAISSGTEPYRVSGLIKIDGKDIIMNCASTNSATRPWVAYDKDMNITRVGSLAGSATTQYTFDSVNYPNDYYIRLGMYWNSESINAANYGTVLNVDEFSEYVPLTELEQRVDALDGGERVALTLSDVNYIYTVHNSVKERNYVSKLNIAHLLSGASFLNKGIFFENGQRSIPVYPSTVATKEEIERTIQVKPKDSYLDTQVVFKQRNTNNVASKSVSPRVLVIGDSVTNGYGASANKAVSWFPIQYWAFAKMFFEMDKIDGGDNSGEYNALFIGTANGGFTINYDSVSRTVRAHAEAKGGASLDELFGPTWGGTGSTTPNPFYDSVGNTFSVASYLNKYRTMDDLGVRLVTASANPAGETVVGSDGRTYTIGTEIDTQAKLSGYDVCTPTHIVVNMVHNTTVSNYENNVGSLISIIQNELPGVPVILAVIDETGTYFPKDHPDYIASQITYTTLHIGNLLKYDYIRQNVEDENNGIYLLGLNFIQPPVRGYATVKYEDADFAERGENNPGLNVADPNVQGANYHPNNYTHEAFGYSLYAILKYLITS